MPKVVAKMKIYSNDCLFNQKPEGRVFAHVWNAVVNEHLREFNYMADLAKLEFSLSIDLDSIDFTWTGFNDSMMNYIDQTLERINQLKTKDVTQIFNQVKEKLQLDWKNWYLQ